MSPVAEIPRVEGSAVYPLGSRVTERGHLEVGGCDLVELAREFGTPAYVYAEDDIRARARAYLDAFRRAHGRLRGDLREQGAPLRRRVPDRSARRGCRSTWPPGGELEAALRGRLRRRADLHPRQQQDRGRASRRDRRAASATSSSTPSTRSTGSSGSLDRPQDVLIRVTPGIKASTHSYIQTGQLDSKFGFGLDDGLAERAVEEIRASSRLELVGLHAHIGSQIFELEPYTQGDRGPGGPRRRGLPPAQRRRRARHRLHAARTRLPRSRTTST